MPMQPDALKAKMKETIYNGLKKEFAASSAMGESYTPVSDAQWMKMATAISGIAAAGSPAAQVTVAPGQIK
jgi:ABC-type transporter MlaC component